MASLTLPSPAAPVGELLRAWRQRRRRSQLDLSLAAEVSQRHLSWIESGRAVPSREMVLRLSRHLEVPLRERNALLVAAGHAPVFPRRALSDPALQAARAAVEQVLAAHMPFPALALDRGWNMVAANGAVTPLLAGVNGDGIASATQRAEAVYETAGRIRNLKASCGFASRRDLEFILKPAAAVQESLVPVLRTLAGAAGIAISPDYAKGKNTGATLTPLGEVYLPLEGLIDVDAERTRLSKELEKVKSEIGKVDAKLASESFVSRAPAEVVEEHNQRRTDWLAQSVQLAEMLRNLE